MYRMQCLVDIFCSPLPRADDVFCSLKIQRADMSTNHASGLLEKMIRRYIPSVVPTTIYNFEF